MEGRAVIIAACWIAIAMISVVYIWVGGINLMTDIAVGVLVAVAFVVTFGVGFGELDQILQSKKEDETSSEISELRLQISEVAKKVDDIKKALEE
ncbi:MAG: hypothetical protein ACE14P_14730 [Methanotrichaceae archaeon]